MWIVFNNNLISLRDRLTITSPYLHKEGGWHIFITDINQPDECIDAETFEKEEDAKNRFSELVKMLSPATRLIPHRNPFLDKKIIDLDMTPRTTNCLLAEKINTVEDLIDWKEEELRRVQGLGARSMTEVKTTLKSMGLILRK